MQGQRYSSGFANFSNWNGIVSEEDVQRAVEMGADNAMDLAEFSLRFQPFALRRARELYISTCVRLYRAAQEAQR
jgi:hypothetical protein